MNESVSNRQIFVYMFFALAGITVISLPRTMAVNAGTGGWFTLALSTLLFLIPTAALATLNRMFPEQTLFQYATLLVGKVLAVVLSVVYAVYFLGIFAFIAREVSEIIKADFLYKTPLKFILFILVATSLYVTSRGMANLGRILEMELYFAIFVIIALHSMMFFNGDTYNLRPLYNPTKTPEYFKAVANGVPAFLGFEVLAVLPFHKSNLRRGRLYALLAILAVGLTYIYIVESCYSILGVDDIINYDDAMIVAVRRIDAPYLEIFRRVDLIFLVAWLTAVLSTLNIYNYGFHSIACSLFPRAGKWPVMVVVGAAAFVIGMWPSCYVTNQKYFDQFVYTLAPFTGFLIPAVLLIMTRIRKNVIPKNR